MLLTNNKKYYEKAKVLRSWGRMSTLIKDSENIVKRLNIKLKGIPCCDLISYVIPREKLNSSGIYINSSNNQNFICFFSNNKTFEIIKIENNNLFKLDKKIESIYTNGDSLNINIDLNNKVKIEKISFLEIIVKNLKNIYLLPEKAIIEPIYISNNKILN